VDCRVTPSAAIRQGYQLDGAFVQYPFQPVGLAQMKLAPEDHGSAARGFAGGVRQRRYGKRVVEIGRPWRGVVYHFMHA